MTRTGKKRGVPKGSKWSTATRQGFQIRKLTNSVWDQFRSVEDWTHIFTAFDLMLAGCWRLKRIDRIAAIEQIIERLEHVSRGELAYAIQTGDIPVAARQPKGVM